MEIVQLSQTYFCFELPSVLLKKRTEKLETSTTLASIHRFSYITLLMFVSFAVFIFHCLLYLFVLCYLTVNKVVYIKLYILKKRCAGSPFLSFPTSVHRRNHPMGPVGRVPSKNWEPWDQYHLVPLNFHEWM